MKVETKATRKKKLPVKHELFVSEFLKNGCNRKKAVQKVFPQYKTDGSIRTKGWELMTNIDIQQRIYEAFEKEGLTIEFITSQLSKMIRNTKNPERLKALRTACEVLGLIGKSGVFINQTNNINTSMIDAQKVAEELVNKREKEFSGNEC